MGLPGGQARFDETEITPVESTSALVDVAGIVSSGMFNCREVIIDPKLTDCNAARLTSTLAPPMLPLAVTNPCSTAGEGAPTSATSGIVFRFTPFGTFITAVALYGRLLGPTATATMSNVPAGKGQKRKFPLESVAVSITMRSIPVLSGCSMATSTVPAIGAFVTESTI